MAKNHLLKSIEIAAIVLFVLILAYLAVTGLLSSTGVDHAWPYPSK
ncbi:hypothetical protein [Pantoea agglomerans]|uniref:Uncharacterized protein n=1 Tax=Enterobacter agglomerans TaxID=549 RepID=A0A379AEV0_ENTAG|nr:hypothetical protein [Pantoea agglomerans]MBD8142197.1 hypothetical protein [Pantoea agglomerans]MBD8180659.1 hypothetical protein [Pantoea agglomerans]MBD8220708.1 hypothetical protein [Pantoea agglomerans]QXB57118.1 hypothetical protein I6L77_10580 [Pantoea agglomerans]WVL81693.1 hypothetical protein IFT78_008440 [Pantoea agglomerans]